MTYFIGLIDGNNFYASCEQSMDPSLINHPLVILSNNDGCIISRSSKARKLGIKMGQPYFKIRHKLIKNRVIVKSSNYSLYEDISQRMMSIIKENCEEVEIYSIDEAFIKIKHNKNINILTWCSNLRELIYKSLSIPIAIGIGRTKVEAKLANYIAKDVPKHAGSFNLATEIDKDNSLEIIPIEKVWGIGKSLSQYLRRQGINNAKELRYMPINILREGCGVIGIRIQHEINGIECIPIRLMPANKKETCTSRSFGSPVTKLEELCEAVVSYVIRSGEKLREQNQLAGAITIFIKIRDGNQSFISRKATIKLDIPTNNTFHLIARSLSLTKKIFSNNLKITKAGVLMHNLHPINYIQQNILIKQEPEKLLREERLMKTIDALNKRYGKGSLTWSLSSHNKIWAMRQRKLSPKTTTKINEIPIVKA